MDEEVKPLIVGGAIIVILIIALSLLFTDWGSFLEGRRTEQRRKIFKSSQSYNEGKIQDLVKYRHEYYLADKKGKESIAFIIRHAYSDYDETALTPVLKKFLKKIKYGESK